MREAAFFDLDKTVIAKASMVAFGVPFYRHGLVSRATLLRALYAQVVYMQLGADDAKLERMRTSVLALTKGWDQARVREIVRETLDDVVQPIIYAEAADLIAEHRGAGRLVYLVSASPEELVEPLGSYLGVDGVIATRARLDAEGRYSGELEHYAYGPGKAIAMRALCEREHIDLGRSYGYSDSASDVPMLEIVGHPVAVNPDRELARVAHERGWEIRHFVHPVRLRDRVPVPPAGVSAAVGSAIGAAAVGVGVWWRLRARRPPAPPTSWERLATRLEPSWPRWRRGRSG